LAGGTLHPVSWAKLPFRSVRALNPRAACILDGTRRVDGLCAFCIPSFGTAAKAELWWLLYTAHNKMPYLAFIHDLFWAGRSKWRSCLRLRFISVLLAVGGA